EIDITSPILVIIMKKVKGKHRWRSRSAYTELLSSKHRTPNLGPTRACATPQDPEAVKIKNSRAYDQKI
ncbi:MAG TPA: hypothetical protein DEG17_02255, partial [Cyanobacteria bacterium UBA11149]|nr:hypothetical protein [Cyanobacteria bacterium UBA11366]HBK61985.1 hypothetical protein [Cyanobacteria bacterium UBA11166]HBR75107.1 hypothetical protein [Cyanobacteria bacterium UBA11159]HBW87728.1 hypothetical protein [Cyanobacteria bacterium UBA11149]